MYARIGAEVFKRIGALHGGLLQLLDLRLVARQHRQVADIRIDLHREVVPD